MNDRTDIEFYDMANAKSGQVFICDRCGCLVYNREAHLSMCPYATKKVHETLVTKDPVEG